MFVKSYLDKAFQIGVDPSAIFHSLNERVDGADIITINSHSLKTAFIETDQACRDENARLQDLEIRLRFFMERIKSVAERVIAGG